MCCSISCPIKHFCVSSVNRYLNSVQSLNVYCSFRIGNVSISSPELVCNVLPVTAVGPQSPTRETSFLIRWHIFQAVSSDRMKVIYSFHWTKSGFNISFSNQIQLEGKFLNQICSYKSWLSFKEDQKNVFRSLSPRIFVILERIHNDCLLTVLRYLEVCN